MRFIQVPTCIAIVAAPYWILYNKTALKDNFNNGGLALRAIGYYILANGVKVLAMATGIPSLLGHYLIGEEMVMAILDCALCLGLVMPLRGKTNANANVSSIVLGIGLGWSLPENIGRMLFETVATIRDLDQTDGLLYAALRSNFAVLSSVMFTALLFLWQRDKSNRYRYVVMMSIAMIVCTVMSS
ncbi:membrane protein, putative [Babesia bigemina]|uniref:BOS complex subunit TMEM147 n=1 Tax=Babesia bigemina TaxID=5866 RepID=A0A061D9B3_BABBI|nr:membrane protein, putative [Babesia bigemina]CDR95509.1 membrane protein, putative [Babesia bigemina]|eukprot:XP_012767695.1 membrane protein, putative [Babesia bigemina]